MLADVEQVLTRSLLYDPSMGHVLPSCPASPYVKSKKRVKTYHGLHMLADVG